MHKISLIILLSIIHFSCDLNQPLEYYPMNEDDVVFVKPKQGDLIAYTAVLADTGEQAQTGRITIERTPSLTAEIFPDFDDTDISPTGLLMEITSISGFNQMKNDIREKHIATLNSGALFLYALRTRNNVLYYVREPGADNIGVEILPDSINDLASTFSVIYDIEKCDQANACNPVGSYNLQIQKLGNDPEVNTPVGVFGAVQLRTQHQIEIIDGEYTLNYRFIEIGLVNPPIGIIKFSLDYDDFSNLESQTSLTLFAEVIRIKLPEILNEE